MKSPIRFRLPWRTRSTINAEVDAELEFHLDARAAELVAMGMNPDAARREAEREFGDIERTRAYCRAEDTQAERAGRRRDRFDELRGNVRYALRTLRRSPGFTAVTLVTLALAIGANTSIFSVANAILFAPLPYGDPGRVVAIFENNTKYGNARADMSAADLVDYRAMQTTLTDVGIYSRGGGIFRRGADDPVALQNLRVSANFFAVLGAQPERGRTFAPGEDGPGARVALLTHDAWMRIYNGDTAAVGSAVFINDQPFTLIGVMPRGFGLGLAEDLYTPLDMTPQLNDANRARKMHWLYAIGRLKPDVSAAAANADFNRIAHTLEQQYPDANTGHYATVIPIQTALAGSSTRAMVLLLGAALLVLLVACANLTNMMLARAASRAREMTIRSAIGAGRAHLIVQLVTESVLLGVAGGAMGIAVATFATPLIVRMSSTALPVMARPALDWRVLAFAVGVSLLIGLVIGIIPALRVSRVDFGAMLKSSARNSGGRSAHRLNALLVISQTSLAVVLLVVAGLLLRSLENVRHVDAGFDPQHALVVGAIVRGPKYQSKEGLNSFYDALLERLGNAPGVVAVGGSANVPLIGNSGCGLMIEGQAIDPAKLPDVSCGAARGDYFRAMGIPLLRGRNFDRTDLPDGPQVVIINAAMAKKFFPNEDPLGKRIRLGPNPAAPWETIVGVTGDVRQNSLEETPLPTAIEYDAQHGWGTLAVVIRAEGDPMKLAPAIRAAVRGVDPSLAVRMIRTMDDIIGLQLASRRLTMTLIAGFALLGLVLAAVGIYGVLAYGVTERTREFGIRLALGASAGALSASVLRRGLAWSAIGLALGGAGAMVAGRALRSTLYGVAPYDVLTFGAVSAILLGVAALACLIPARRAVRVDPIIAMRAE